MKMRITAGIIIISLSVLVPPLVLLPLVILHAFSWFALELVIIGVAIDMYFGVITTIPYYTISAIGIVFLAEWVKPHLLFYTKE